MDLKKKCSKCAIEQSLTDFHRKKSSKDGYSYVCKICKAAADSLYLLQNRDRLLDYKKNHYQLNREKYAANNTEWYEQNKEKHKEIGEEWTRKNRKKSNAIKKKWRDANSEACQSFSKKWRLENPERVRAMWRRRREAMKQATPPWADKAELREFYKKTPVGYEVDHYCPLQGEIVSGLHVLWNLRYVTPEENRQKGHKWPLET